MSVMSTPRRTPELAGFDCHRNGIIAMALAPRCFAFARATFAEALPNGWPAASMTLKPSRRGAGPPSAEAQGRANTQSMISRAGGALRHGGCFMPLALQPAMKKSPPNMSVVVDYASAPGNDELMSKGSEQIFRYA